MANYKFIKILSTTLLTTSALSILLLGCNQGSSVSSSNMLKKEINSDKVVPDFWPKLVLATTTNGKLEQEISDMLAKMTLEQKVAQMIQPEIGQITVEDMRKYGFGSYLNGGGSFPNKDKQATPADWIKLAENLYQASIDDTLDGSTIPTMWGTDAVHGHNNVIGATLFPHNIGLGAAHNPELLEKIASITAKEVMVTGIDWVFAPTVAVVRDDRWGRTYEGYSEDPEIVKNYASAIVKGLQGSGDSFLSEQHVIGTVKHFIGDGGTVDGDDQGNNISSEKDLFELHAQGYVGGLTAGAQTVMASFNSWHGVKSHGNKYLLTDVLKTRMGFDGLVVGDWNGHGQVKGCTNESCSQAVNAGLDIYMASSDNWKAVYDNTISQVQSGEISQARIDDAVTRILRVKKRAGLFSKPSPANRPLSGNTNLIGSTEHRDIARQAVRESLVLLKNKNSILPLAPTLNVLVTGDGADNIGKQSGGWTITWQGTGNKNKDFPGGTSIYAGIEQVVKAAGGSVSLSDNGEFNNKPDVAIVVFGEEPYAEGNGDIENLEFQRGNKKDLALLKSLKDKGIPVVSIFISGRPMWVNAEINASDAFVAAWLPGSEGHGISEVLFSKANGEVNYDFTGKLSYSWPISASQTAVNRFDKSYNPLFEYGFGLNYSDKDLLEDMLDETTVITNKEIKALSILKGSVQAPWSLFISASGKRQEMVSSIIENEVIHLRTIDKEVQEDARQITFNGKGEGSLALTSQFPTDLLAHIENKSSLTFAIKIQSAISESVNISMNCEQECIHQLNITSDLQKLAPNTWQNMSIDLACFSQKGTDMGKVFTPFSLSTNGLLKLSIADISIRSTSMDKMNVSCSP